MDFLGYFLKKAPSFRGKRRLRDFWLKTRRPSANTYRTLPGDKKVFCDLSIPYEAMVWLCQEEEEDLKILKKLLRTQDFFVDCGANIGIWSLVAASVVFPHGKVYSFEPNPSTFAKLSKNIALNRAEDMIQGFNVACAEKNDALMFRCEAHHNHSGVSADMNDETISVPGVSLDSILEKKAICGIKVDVEGFELSVLKGANTILTTWKPWICVEFNPEFVKSNRLSEWEVHRYLASLGYRCSLFRDALDSGDQKFLKDSWSSKSYCNLFYQVPNL